jgi:hypothetical protein
MIRSTMTTILYTVSEIIIEKVTDELGCRFSWGFTRASFLVYAVC